MISVQEARADYATPPPADAATGIQAGGFLLELSLDWIVRRASENIHLLLGHGHAHLAVVDEPLGKFVQSQALHDLRNLFSRLSGTTGIARAYRVRLTNDPDLVDVAFQLSDGRVLLEAVPCAEEHYGEAFGTVGGLIAGLSSSSGQALLDGAARRMRALTGYDRVTLSCVAGQAESSRGPFSAAAARQTGLPPIICDLEQQPVPVFPRKQEESSIAHALMCSVDQAATGQLRAEGVRATMTVPFDVDGVSGEFRCDSRTARRPSFELHAAAELFAQLFGLRLQVDQLKTARA